MKYTYLLFSLFLMLGLQSCNEIPVHEEYGLDGTIHDNNSNSEDTWWPLAINNTWNYNSASIFEEYHQTYTIAGTETFGGDTYYTINITTDSSLSAPSYTAHIKRENNVFTFRTVAEANGTVSDPIYSHPLKDGIAVGDSWDETLNIVYTGAVNTTIVSHYTYTYEEHFDEFDIDGTLFNDVAKIKTHLEAEYQGQPVVSDSYTYFALNIGPIRIDGGSSVSLIDSYSVN